MKTQYSKLTILLLALTLSACVSQPPEIFCDPSNITPLKEIKRSELSEYWVPIKKRTRVYPPDNIQQAIVNGRVGIVIIEETIDAGGKRIDKVPILTYPDKFFLEEAIRDSKDQVYGSVTCPITPVRFRSIVTFSNNGKTEKLLWNKALELEQSL